eukprot:300102-Ditylum_brightwellii.AAC.1
MSRRSQTKLPMEKHDKCPVYFVLGYCNLSYYIKCGYGNSMHASHMNVTCNNDSFAPGRLMDKVQQSIAHLENKAKSKNCKDMDYVNASGILVNDLNDVSEDGDIIAFAVNYLSDELSAMRMFCITQRNSIQCQGQYNMAIGTAWTLKSICTLARAYGK